MNEIKILHGGDDITEKMMSGSLQNTVGAMINEEENKVVILLKDSESLDKELEYIDKNKIIFGEFIGAIDQSQKIP